MMVDQGNLTLGKIIPEDYPVYRYQEPHLHSPEIAEIQQLLKVLDFYEGEVDGIFGLMTKKAIVEFRTSAGLEAFDIIDADLYRALATRYEKNVLPASEPVAVKAGEIILVVVLSERTLYVMQEHSVIAKFPIAIGKPKTPSPIGEWRVANMGSWGGPFGSRWLGLSTPWGVYGIHGTNRPYSIGGAASAGCIRMFNRDVEKLYKMVKWGTKVFIINEPFGVLGRGLYPLAMGSKGSLVYLIQRRLRQLEYYEKKPDGIFGWWTHQAVKAFQKDYGMEVTGRMETWMYKEMGIFLFE